MIRLYCTNKVLTALNTLPQPTDDNHVNTGLGDWYCNLFTFNRRQCLAFMNVKTLSCFILPNLLKKDMNNFHDFFINGVQAILKQSGTDEKLINTIVSECIHIQITKTESRSALGSLNDYVLDYKYKFEKNKNPDIQTINHFNTWLLKKPNSIFKYRTPMEVLMDLLDKEYR